MWAVAPVPVAGPPPRSEAPGIAASSMSPGKYRRPHSARAARRAGPVGAGLGLALVKEAEVEQQSLPVIGQTRCSKCFAQGLRVGIFLGLRWNIDFMDQYSQYQEAKASLEQTEAQQRQALGAIDLEIIKLHTDAANAQHYELPPAFFRL